MKKSLFLLGVAAAVFSGCSNQEVMDVAEYANQVIQIVLLFHFSRSFQLLA